MDWIVQFVLNFTWFQKNTASVITLCIRVIICQSACVLNNVDLVDQFQIDLIWQRPRVFSMHFEKLSSQDKTELQIPAVQEVALWTQLQTMRQQRINPAAAGARLGLILGNPKREGSYRRFKGIKSFNRTLLNEVIQTSDTKLQYSWLPLLRKGFVSNIPVFNPFCALTVCVSSFSADVRKTYCYIVWWTGME